MILATDKSTVLAQLKVGTKNLTNIDRTENKNEQTPPNYVYGIDLVRILKEKNTDFIKEPISKETLKNLDTLINSENTKPFFLFIRNNEKLFRSQIIQGLRNFCRAYPIFDENTTLEGSNISQKNNLFDLLIKTYPLVITEIYSDFHYVKNTFDEALFFLQYIEHYRPDIFNNLYILDLDEHDKSEESLNLLNSLKVVDIDYFNSSNKIHSTKELFFPNSLLLSNVPPICKVPYFKNHHSLYIIRNAYKDKLYDYKRLSNHYSSPI